MIGQWLKRNSERENTNSYQGQTYRIHRPKEMKEKSP